MEPSLKLKEEGNQYFLQKNFVAALDKYSQAIVSTHTYTHINLTK